MVVYAPAQIISAPAQLITAPAQPPATGAVVYTALFYHLSHLLSWCKVCAKILCSLRGILDSKYSKMKKKIPTVCLDMRGEQNDRAKEKDV